MSIHPAPIDYLLADFVPQAELKSPIHEMETKFGLVRDCDDLDDCTGGAFIVDDRWVFTIKHYKGSDENTFTVYLPRTIEAENVRPYVLTIVENLELPVSSLTWERSRDPDF